MPSINNSSSNNYSDISADWKDYQAGIDYKRRIDLYATVDKNERMYAGDQWNGVKNNGLPTPVFNIIKRVINYFIAALVSQPYKMQFSTYDGIAEDEQAKNLTRYIDQKWEFDKLNGLIMKGLLDAAVSGDLSFHTYWNTKAYVDGITEGDFEVEKVDNVNMFFGNPNSNIVNKNGRPYQPYILVAGRETVFNLKAEARKNGISEDKIMQIVADSDYTNQSGDRGKYELDGKEDNVSKATYVVKYYLNEETNTIFMRKSIRVCQLTKDVDTELQLYPICWMNWDERKNSYHGQAPITGIIPNQIYINKQFAMIMKHMMDTALSKVIYDKHRITAWSNEVGVAIGCEGDITGAAQTLPVGQMSSGILDIINTTISLTKDLLGATDAALGNVAADNTSAIIAVQKSSAVPLEIIKANMMQFIEDLGYIWLDFVRAKYITPRTATIQEDGETRQVEVGGKQDLRYRIKVDVGASTMWSELTALQTLDNLLSADKITFIQYLQRVPNGIIPEKQKLIDELNQQLELEQQQLQQQQGQQQNMDYEQMAQFMETLPDEEQVRLQQMDPAQMEAALKVMQQQQIQMSPQK
jgi:hypothetical protein